MFCIHFLFDKQNTLVSSYFIMRQDFQLHSDPLKFFQLCNVLFVEFGGLGLEPGCGQ